MPFLLRHHHWVGGGPAVWPPGVFLHTAGRCCCLLGCYGDSVSDGFEERLAQGTPSCPGVCQHIVRPECRREARESLIGRRRCPTEDMASTCGADLCLPLAHSSARCR